MPKVDPRYAKYIGRPWQEPDGCLLLVREVMAKEFQIRPEIGEYDATSLRGRSAAFRDGLARLCRRVSQAEEGDLVIVCSGGRPYHIGVCVAPGMLLHCRRGAATCIQRIEDVEGQKEFFRIG